MKRILILGAGRSSVILIKYLQDNSIKYNWKIIVADYSKELALQAIGDCKQSEAIHFDATIASKREKEIMNSDIVVSMLPPNMHFLVAEDCVRLKKDLVTASYVSNEIKDLDTRARESGVLLLNEIGLDPGIDHMSAMNIIDRIKDKNGTITSFKSFCGGLIHPDHDDNPWNYKFTWNPRNVVLAGQGFTRYLENGVCKDIPYNKIFQDTATINILDLGEFEGYANRDSLKYREAYGLEGISTLFRGTLRRKGYSKAWNIFVQLGMTDDSYKIDSSEYMSNREFTRVLLCIDNIYSVEEEFCRRFDLTQDSLIFKKIEWLGLFSDEKLNIKNGSPAQILQNILQSRWGLSKEDKDMIVMQHQFEYFIKGEKNQLHSSLIVFGDNSKYTAMSKTVGLPVAIAVKLILNKVIRLTGVRIPTIKEIYTPVLRELEENRISFVNDLI